MQKLVIVAVALFAGILLLSKKETPVQTAHGYPEGYTWKEGSKEYIVKDGVIYQKYYNDGKTAFWYLTIHHPLKMYDVNWKEVTQLPGQGRG